MFASFSLFVTASLCLFGVVDAAPRMKRQATGDNGACQQLVSTCTKAVDKSLSNVFAIESCVFAATCFNGQRPVDNFLAAVYATKNPTGTTPPKSVNLARVTSAVLNAISTHPFFISRQNFIDGFYGQLAITNGPWPASADVVIGYLNRVAVWTAFCDGDIAFKNFQDYFQYSASVSSNGCGSSTITLSPPTSIPIPITSTPTSSQLSTIITFSTTRVTTPILSTSVAVSSTRVTTQTPITVSPSQAPASPSASSSQVPASPSASSSQAPASPSASPSQAPASPSASPSQAPSPPISSIVTVSSTPITSASPSTLGTTAAPSTIDSSSGLTITLLPTTTVSSQPPTGTPPTISSDSTCQKMFLTCVDQVNSSVTNLFAIKSCVLGAACAAGSRPVAGFASAVQSWKRGGSPPTDPVNQPRVSTTLFNAGSTDGGKTWTQQNFIDAYYSQLSAVGGPYPPNANLVISYFNRIAAWTGFCGKGIPYQNFADYFQYSATVNGPAVACT